MLGTKEQAETIIRECPEWFHSIELAPGVFTPGRTPAESLAGRLASLQLPDLEGKSVLDIGAYDGFFSFEAERRGASRVVALDHYAWFADMAAYMKEWRDSWRTGKAPPAPSETRHWRPAELPGRRPFDRARALLQSKVEPMVGDLMMMDLASLGQFDVVLFLGILYHLEDPLRAMRRLYDVTKEVAVISTQATEFPGINSAVCEFFPGAELNNDASNWWTPNAAALIGLCRAAGFRRVALISSPPWRSSREGLQDALTHLVYETRLPRRLGRQSKNTITPLRYEAIAHAWR